MSTVTNPKVQQWLNALRSGRYTQAKYCLHERDGGYCCLGVAEEEIWGAEFVPNPDGSSEDNLGLIGSSGDFRHLMREDHAEELDLSESDLDELANLNDAHDFDFNAIADVVERAHNEHKFITDVMGDMFPEKFDGGNEEDPY